MDPGSDFGWIVYEERKWCVVSRRLGERELHFANLSLTLVYVEMNLTHDTLKP